MQLASGKITLLLASLFGLEIGLSSYLLSLHDLLNSRLPIKFNNITVCLSLHGNSWSYYEIK